MGLKCSGHGREAPLPFLPTQGRTKALKCLDIASRVKSDVLVASKSALKKMAKCNIKK